MTYFVLEVHPAYSPPQIKNWFGVLDQKSLKQKNRTLLPKHAAFRMENHMHTVYTDIILNPCFLVSKGVMEVIRLYEPRLRFESLILLNQEKKIIRTYHLPKLEELDVLTANSRFNRDKSVLYHAEIDATKTKKKAIFQVANIGHPCILIRLDLVESLLRRKAVGIGLRVCLTSSSTTSF